jgi:CRISPR/Cas system Type II protein with McrA/HNH and RuvC-like nuclease domain
MDEPTILDKAFHVIMKRMVETEVVQAYGEIDDEVGRLERAARRRIRRPKHLVFMHQVHLKFRAHPGNVRMAADKLLEIENRVMTLARHGVMEREEVLAEVRDEK